MAAKNYLLIRLLHGSDRGDQSGKIGPYMCTSSLVKSAMPLGNADAE